ncbi:predicted protein [Plenodomus lingam JN3]|uniref:Predicted protein n=1 Tax=Leptosphaeria maculans (strain JN3 / isolate v23.1.3 / race Av1-4-5-6-7-8) TaxID=985895 RepID=E5A2T6_LEPMJ|nr:predicted protein [Plenodomus lingam JN3]CBX97882.1 predicted protein [Plenodomus lingam JN3]
MGAMAQIAPSPPSPYAGIPPSIASIRGLACLKTPYRDVFFFPTNTLTTANTALIS